MKRPCTTIIVRRFLPSNASGGEEGSPATQSTARPSNPRVAKWKGFWAFTRGGALLEGPSGKSGPAGES